MAKTMKTPAAASQTIQSIRQDPYFSFLDRSFADWTLESLCQTVLRLGWAMLRQVIPAPSDYVRTGIRSRYTSDPRRKGSEFFTGHFSEGFDDAAASEALFGKNCLWRRKINLGDVVLSSSWIWLAYRASTMRRGPMNVKRRAVARALI